MVICGGGGGYSRGHRAVVREVVLVVGSGRRERVVIERSRTPHLHWHCQEDECGGEREGDGGECMCCGGRQRERGREVVHRSTVGVPAYTLWSLPTRGR